VDPNRDGYVSLQEYMAFMISKETENVQSSEEIENAFRAITSGERPYVTKEELYAVSCLIHSLLLLLFLMIFHLQLQNLTKEMADYCVSRMNSYVDPKTGKSIPGALDYMDFTRTLFQN
jgi:spectrin alpha